MQEVEIRFHNKNGYKGKAVHKYKVESAMYSEGANVLVLVKKTQTLFVMREHMLSYTITELDDGKKA